MFRPEYISGDFLEMDSINKLSKTSAADCFQIRSVSKDRFFKKIGIVNDEVMEEIEMSLIQVLKIR